MKKFTCPIEKCTKHGAYTNSREFLSAHLTNKHTYNELSNVAESLGLPEPIGYEARWQLQYRILDKVAEDLC